MKDFFFQISNKNTENKRTDYNISNQNLIVPHLASNMSNIIRGINMLNSGIAIPKNCKIFISSFYLISQFIIFNNLAAYFLKWCSNINIVTYFFFFQYIKPGI